MRKITGDGKICRGGPSTARAKKRRPRLAAWESLAGMGSHSLHGGDFVVTK